MRIAALTPVAAVLAMLVLGPAPAGAGQMVGTSPLSGMVFDDKPALLEDKGAFRDLMDKVAADVKRACGPLEIYGWEVAEDDQDRVDKLEKMVNGHFRAERFLVREAKAGVIWNADADAFTADKGEIHLLVLLSLSPSPTRERTSDLALLICAAPFLPRP